MIRGLPGLTVEFLQARVRALRRVVMEDLKDLNRFIAHVLRGGVVVSVATLLLGLAIATFEGGAYPNRVIPIPQALELALQLRPEGLLSLGVVVLIVTPVIRVVISIASFLKGREGLYVGITALVLFNLFLGFLFGFV